jgi:hypothetical protein
MRWYVTQLMRWWYVTQMELNDGNTINAVPVVLYPDFNPSFLIDGQLRRRPLNSPK